MLCNLTYVWNLNETKQQQNKLTDTDLWLLEVKWWGGE